MYQRVAQTWPNWRMSWYWVLVQMITEGMKAVEQKDWVL